MNSLSLTVAVIWIIQHVIQVDLVLDLWWSKAHFLSILFNESIGPLHIILIKILIMWKLKSFFSFSYHLFSPILLYLSLEFFAIFNWKVRFSLCVNCYFCLDESSSTFLYSATFDVDFVRVSWVFFFLETDSFNCAISFIYLFNYNVKIGLAVFHSWFTRSRNLILFMLFFGNFGHQLFLCCDGLDYNTWCNGFVHFTF